MIRPSLRHIALRLAFVAMSVVVASSDILRANAAPPSAITASGTAATVGPDDNKIGSFFTVCISTHTAGSGSGTIGGWIPGGGCALTTLPVYLTATPAAGSAFIGWSGGCSGTGVCSTGGGAVTATFIAGLAFTSANSTTFAVGKSGSFTLAPTGVPAPSVALAGALPAGVTFNPSTNVLSGIPAAGTVGSYPLAFTASNAVAPNLTQSFTLTVATDFAGTVSNISTRSQVLTGGDVMIAGFIIAAGSQKVVINVAGPSLANFGIANFLANPKLTIVRQSDQAVIASNDDWRTQAIPADVAAIQASGFQPNGALEPAVILTLPPGAYTAIVEGSGGGTGVAVVGVFTVP